MTRTVVPDQNLNGNRARGFPTIALDEAVDRVKKLYVAEDKHAVTNDVAAGHWGYSATSSSSRSTLATLKKFGLLEEVGGGTSGKVRISRLALDVILHDDDEHRQERLKALRTAALMPPIHATLWEKWGPRLPSDGSMRSHLIRELGFNEATAAAFIKEFKRTISCARLDQADQADVEVPGDEDEATPPASNGGPGSMPSTPAVSGWPGAVSPPTVFQQPASPTGVREEVFTLDEGQVTLRYPPRLTAQSYEDFDAWLQLISRKAKRSVRECDNGNGV